MESHDSQSSQLGEPRFGEQSSRYEDSETTVAAIFGGIAALFIAGIAAAFLYAKDTNPTQSASAPAPSAASSAPASSTFRVPETTGSGAINTPSKQQTREDEQKERP